MRLSLKKQEESAAALPSCNVTDEPTETAPQAELREAVRRTPASPSAL
jgi:hypothetical protein